MILCVTVLGDSKMAALSHDQTESHSKYGVDILPGVQRLRAGLYVRWIDEIKKSLPLKEALVKFACKSGPAFTYPSYWSISLPSLAPMFCVSSMATPPLQLLSLSSPRRIENQH
jgi:hypothetical protein